MAGVGVVGTRLSGSTEERPAWPARVAIVPGEAGV